MEGAVIPMEGVSTGQEGTTLGPIRGTTPTAENKPTEGPTPTAETMSVEGTTPTAESHTRATQSEKSHQEPSSLREKEENKTSSKNEKNPKKVNMEYYSVEHCVLYMQGSMYVLLV